MATNRDIIELLHRLSESQRRRVLEFAREIAEAKPPGGLPSDLIAFGGRIPLDDLQRIQDAIDEGREAVNLTAHASTSSVRQPTRREAADYNVRLLRI